MTLTYLLPLRRDDVAEEADSELLRYLRRLAARVDLLIVDGSPATIFERHAELFAGLGVHVAPDPLDRCANGKAWGVLTGLRVARHDVIVIADDDVRWDAATLSRASAELAGCDLLLPENFFEPMTWHAAWDTGRILINRATTHDWPGTVVVRRSALTRTPRYQGNVLFENCELLRTVAADGGRVVVARGLFVPRRPPTVRHFLGQRARQAYDDLAQPLRLAAMVSVIPCAFVGGRRAITWGAVLCVALAEAGRRRAGGARVFPWYTSLCAPLWLAERGVLAWWALWLRTSGRGVPYAGTRVVLVASTRSTLRRHRANP